MQTSIKNSIEIKLIKKDNNSFYVHMDTLNVLDDNNNFKEFRISITDITEIKEAAKEVELANKYNRSLIEASLDPLVTIGPDGKITDVNKSTEKELQGLIEMSSLVRIFLITLRILKKRKRVINKFLN